MTALFDLDGVLTRHDTTAALVRIRIARRPLRLLPVALLAVASLAAPATGRLRSRLHRAIVHTAFRGVSEDDYVRLLADAVPRMAARPGFRCLDGEWALRMALHAGPVVVVTAAERRLARAWLTAVGLGRVPVEASTARFDERGMRVVDHHAGERKLQRARAAGVDVARSSMTTDSLSDLPLASAAARCVLVNASARAALVAGRHCRSLRTVRWA